MPNPFTYKIVVTPDTGLSVPPRDVLAIQVHKQCTAEPLSACIGCWAGRDLKCQKQLCGSVMCGDFSTQFVLLHWLNYFSYLGHQTTMPSHWFIAQGWRKQGKDLFSLALSPYHSKWINILFSHLSDTKTFTFHTNVERRS